MAAGCCVWDRTIRLVDMILVCVFVFACVFAVVQSKRVGRGIGSGKGKTCGKGHKGTHQRGSTLPRGFEGGQTPLFRRLPKIGFNNKK